MSSAIELDNEGKYNKRFMRYMTYRDLLQVMLAIHSDLAKAYELKERYINFNKTASYEGALEQIDAFYSEFVNAQISEFADFNSILGNWNKEIAHSFIHYHGRRLTNGISESLNSKVKTLIFNSEGIRDSVRRKKRIMYVVNKDGFSF